jgi:starvation-inducible DNA-binding protein
MRLQPVGNSPLRLPNQIHGSLKMAQVKIVQGSDTQRSALNTPTDLSKQATTAIAAELNMLAADAFALYLKTKNFHWHVSGPHFRDYHLMLDEHADQIFATIDPLTERVRKLGQPTLRSISHVAKLMRIEDNNAEFVSPFHMLGELVEDNKRMAAAMRNVHGLCDDHKDVATASLLEVYIDETERRTWFLFEASRGADETGH